VGRGVAIALAGTGFHVRATGRTIESADLPPAIARVRCDHLRDDDTAAAFERIDDLDLLVNNAWGGYERMVENGQFTWTAPFWEQPAHRWTSMIDVGVRGAFFASAHAARLMIPHRRGLIVNISFWAAQKRVGNAIYGISKAAIDKMTFDTAAELRPHGIAVVSLYPGLVRTESVMEAARGGWLDIRNSESPEFVGRVVAALNADPHLMDRSGCILVAAQVARELGVADIDGTHPTPLTIEHV
jgi:NAD(P)-dependent dehydrogenase (short-subunit alcohol dehydrogenase family)